MMIMRKNENRKQEETPRRTWKKPKEIWKTLDEI